MLFFFRFKNLSWGRDIFIAPVPPFPSLPPAILVKFPVPVSAYMVSFKYSSSEALGLRKNYTWWNILYEYM